MSRRVRIVSSWALLVANAAGCESSAERLAATPPSATIVASAPAPGASPPAPTAIASAPAAPTFPTDAPLRQQLSKTRRVRVAATISADGGRRTRTVADATTVSALLDAVGLDQTPTRGCLRCEPLLSFALDDEADHELGKIGLFCEDDGTVAAATFRDSSDRCAMIQLAKPQFVRDFLKQTPAE